MCTDCNTASSVSCNCRGGDVFTICPCEKGVHCPICGHDSLKAGARIGPDILKQIWRKPSAGKK